MKTDRPPHASELRFEAEAILDRGLRRLLTAYGEVVVHGSCILDTMTHRDLDLYVVVPRFDVRRFFQLGVALVTLLTPHKMHFRDERAGPLDNLPAGLYWGVHQRMARSGGWKIDIWAVTAPEAERLMQYEEHLVRALTPELRTIILEIKAGVHFHPGYGRTFSSRDVYDAVLAGRVRSFADFEAYLAARGIELLHRGRE
jgi:hypothetical protein